MPVAPPIRILLALSLTTWVGGCSAPPSDPLPSWYDGPSKSAILTFVARVTKEGSPDYVKPGGVEFMRAFAEETYGIPPEQVVGSSGVVKFEIKDGTPQLIKEPKIEFIDDGTGKPVGINRFIGRRPIMAFGNSDGDLQMLQYATAGEGPPFRINRASHGRRAGGGLRSGISYRKAR